MCELGDLIDASAYVDPAEVPPPNQMFCVDLDGTIVRRIGGTGQGPAMIEGERTNS